jgi:hypothetical protein
MKLNRIQLSLHKGWRKRTCAIVVARSSKWSNPHAIGKTMVHIDRHRGLCATASTPSAYTANG